MGNAKRTAKPKQLTDIIADGLDALTDGRGFGAEHQKAFDLANAAPLMADALQKMLTAFGGGNRRDDACNAARAALAKAGVA